MGDNFRMVTEIHRVICIKDLPTLYPKCAISQTMKRQRRISNELQYKAKKDVTQF